MSDEIEVSGKPERVLDAWELEHERRQVAAEERAYETNLKLNQQLDAERAVRVRAEIEHSHALTLQRDQIIFEKHTEFNDARDRRLMWLETAANFQGGNSADAAARADGVLAEYDQRFGASTTA